MKCHITKLKCWFPSVSFLLCFGSKIYKEKVMSFKRALKGLLQHRGAGIYASNRAVLGWGDIDVSKLHRRGTWTGKSETEQLCTCRDWMFKCTLPSSINKPQRDFLWVSLLSYPSTLLYKQSVSGRGVKSLSLSPRASTTWTFLIFVIGLDPGRLEA